MSLTAEQQIKRMSEEIEHSEDALRAINAKLRGYYDRLEIIHNQFRRRTPIKDTEFQNEFRATVLELKTLADESGEFWQQTRTYFRTLDDKAHVIESNRINIKQMNITALAFNRQVDELYTIFKNIQTLAKEVPLRLNWWLLEEGCEDLNKIVTRILFLIRDMGKYL